MDDAVVQIQYTKQTQECGWWSTLKIKFEVQNPTLSAIFFVLLTKKEDFLFLSQQVTILYNTHNQCTWLNIHKLEGKGYAHVSAEVKGKG